MNSAATPDEKFRARAAPCALVRYLLGRRQLGEDRYRSWVDPKANPTYEMTRRGSVSPL